MRAQSSFFTPPQNVSLVVEELSHILAEYALLKARLPSLVTGADMAIEHALDLYQQLQSIIE